MPPLVVQSHPSSDQYATRLPNPLLGLLTHRLCRSHGRGVREIIVCYSFLPRRILGQVRQRGCTIPPLRYSVSPELGPVRNKIAEPPSRSPYPPTTWSGVREIIVCYSFPAESRANRQPVCNMPPLAILSPELRLLSNKTREGQPAVAETLSRSPTHRPCRPHSRRCGRSQCDSSPCALRRAGGSPRAMLHGRSIVVIPNDDSPKHRFNFRSQGQ